MGPEEDAVSNGFVGLQYACPEGEANAAGAGSAKRDEGDPTNARKRYRERVGMRSSRIVNTAHMECWGRIDRRQRMLMSVERGKRALWQCRGDTDS